MSRHSPASPDIELLSVLAHQKASRYRIADRLADAAASIEADFLRALDDREKQTLQRLLQKLHARNQER